MTITKDPKVDLGYLIYVKKFVLKINLGNIFDEENFSKLILDAIKARQDYIVQNNSLEISLNNRIAESLINSSFVSSKLSFLIIFIASKGKNHLLLRTPKQKNDRKKNIALYKDEEVKYEEKSKEVESLKEEIKNLTSK